MIPPYPAKHAARTNPALARLPAVRERENLMSVDVPVYPLAMALRAARRLVLCLVSALALTLFCLAAGAFAQDGPPPHDGPWSIDAGGGAIVFNTYPGSKSYQALPVPYYNTMTTRRFSPPSRIF